MRGVNKVIIIGNLGADPDVKQFQNGGSVTSISVATSEQWTDKQTGERREATEWHRISLYNKLGEIAAQYLRKGSSVYIEGSLRTRKYQDQTGQDRYITEIRADNMQMIGGSPAGQANNQMPNNNMNMQNNPYGSQQGNSGFSGNTYPNNPQQAQGGYNSNNTNAGYQPQSPGLPNQPAQQFGNDNPYMNNPAPAANPQAKPNSSTPQIGAVDDDIPFVYISNQLVGII